MTSGLLLGAVPSLDAAQKRWARGDIPWRRAFVSALIRAESNFEPRAFEDWLVRKDMNAVLKPRTLLFPRGLRGQLTAYGRPARELGMRPDQCQLLIDARAIDSRTHGRMERESRVERTLVCNALGDPR